ncbi:hypothetical protein Acr_07g0013010 [Actinidia rufa]|uniref:Uncharacterized protein n=1 Tax=Actinidia rufa TaxID=165716 RepID=A0A7J0EXC6_9ERIC|nr:hypothetical protein Acr_07g0013010 [Actinidia rufa]
MQSNQLFKRHEISTPVDLIRTEPEKPIDKNSLTRSEGQKKKRKLAEGTSEASAVGIAELQDAITNLRIEFDTQMIGFEEQFGRHTTMLQEIKGMLIRMQSKDEEEEEEED